MFDLAIDSKLRGCDLVRMKIGDVVGSGQIRTRAIVMQQKTGRPVQFELLPNARASLLAWLERRGGTVDDYVFPSRVDYSSHLSTRQYARLVDEWVTGVGLMRSEYGTHSLRRTKASIIYRATGNLRAVQILLGHSKIENTVRYLGIDVEDALAFAETLLTQPMMVVFGDKPGGFGAYHDGMEIYGRAAASKDRQLVAVEGWSHYDLYDYPTPSGIALDRVIPFDPHLPQRLVRPCVGLEHRLETARRLKRVDDRVIMRHHQIEERLKLALALEIGLALAIVTRPDQRNPLTW